MMRMPFIVTLLCFMFLPSATWAERFENAYLSFNLPDGWKCKREGTEHICDAPNPSGKNRVAVMILTAKEPGPDDNLAAYARHLSMADTAKGASVIKQPMQVNIQGTLWIDATLFGSEVPNYYTRYIATVKDNVAVLYTFSVHRSRYEAFAGVSALAVQTLKIKPRPSKR